MPGRGGRTIGRNLLPGQMTFQGLSEVTGVPVTTLKRWKRTGKLTPVMYKQYGEEEVAVFDLDSIVQVKKLRPGTKENSDSNKSS